MTREHRYLVIKLKDAGATLTATEFVILDAIADKLRAYREHRGKRPLECVVVESDWPEYEPTWNAIESRIDAEAN